MNISRNQSGFAALEAILVVIILAIVGFTGWFVWHSKNTTDKTLNSANNSSASQTKSTTPSSQKSSDVKDAPGLVDYKDTATIRNDSDITKLTGAGGSFKQFILSVLHKGQAIDGGDCDQPYTVTVGKLYNQKFAIGNAGACGGYAPLWASVNGVWQEIAGTQQGYKCAVLQQYTVPSVIAGSKCFDANGESVPYSQN